MKKFFSRSWIALIVAVVVSVLIFILDLYTPRGVADGVLYISVIMVFLWRPARRFIFPTALACSVLTAIGLPLSPISGDLLPIAIINRILCLIVIWITAILIAYHLKKVEAYRRLEERFRSDLLEAKEKLESQVVERTAELTQTNRELKEKIEELKIAEANLVLFRSLIDESNDALYLVDPDTSKVLDVNRKACANLGYSREELLTMGAKDISVRFTEVPEAWTKHVEKLKKYGGEINEGVHKRKNGSTFPVEVSIKYIPLEGKNFVVAVARDISERKAVELKLRENENKYRALLDNASDTILLSDMEGNILEANNQAEILLGYPKEQILKMHFTQIHPPDQVEKAREVFSRMTVSGRAGTTDLKVLNKDGRSVPVVISACVIEHSGKKFTQAIIQDISELKKNEETLRMLGDAIEHTSDMVVITDPEGIIEYVNPISEELTGYKREELLGQNPRVLKSGKQNPGFYREMWETVKSGKKWHGEVINKKKSGELYTEAMTISPVADSQGKIAHFVAITRDITREKILMQQLVQAEKLSTLGTFVSGVAHELNNPLTVILGFSRDLADAGGVSDEVRRKLHVVAEQSKRTVRIVKNLSKYSQQSSHEKVRADVNDMVDNALNLHLHRLRLENIRLVRTREATPLLVKVDVNQFLQVFSNIVQNAQEEMTRMHGKGVLTVTTARSGDTVQIAFENNGPSIPEENLKKVFDPFFTTKEAGKWSGLGLNVAYRIVDDNGGKIWAENIGDLAGVRFIVSIPLAEREEKTPVAESASPLPKGFRILFVDDEDAIRFWMMEVLLKEGIFTQLAENGEIAVNLLSESDYDLIISDLMMPGMDGYLLGNWIKQNKPHLMAKYVLATGMVMGGEVEGYCSANGCRVIGKPFNKEDIFNIIRSQNNHRHDGDAKIPGPVRKQEV